MRYIVPGEMSLHGYADDYAIKQSFSADDRSAETISPGKLCEGNKIMDEL